MDQSKYWLLVLNQLKERGLEDILIVSTDNLSGFSQAIENVYPKIHNPSNKKFNKIRII
nr:transposase [Peptoniphilus rhinitidis]